LRRFDVPHGRTETFLELSTWLSGAEDSVGNFDKAGGKWKAAAAGCEIYIYIY
jgi:hypothetical protein